VGAVFTLYGCGRGGIQGLAVRRALVGENWVHDSGWWDVERLWETGNWVDHNVLWDVRGTAISAGDTDKLVVAHNLVGPTASVGVRASVLTDRTLNGRAMTARGNRVHGNIILAPVPVAFRTRGTRRTTTSSAIRRSTSRPGRTRARTGTVVRWPSGWPATPRSPR
jgi:hypothetical protein